MGITGGRGSPRQAVALATLSSIPAKALAVLIPLLALPLAAASFEARVIAAYGLGVSVLSMTGSLNPLLGPSIGLAVAGAGTAQERSSTQRSLRNAGRLAPLVSVLIGCTALALLSGGVLSGSLGVTVVAACGVVSIAQTGDSVRFGELAGHRVFALAGLGSLLAIGGMVAAAAIYVSPVMFLASALCVAPAVRAASIVGRIFGPPVAWSVDGVRPVVVGNFWHQMAQIGNFLGLPFALIFVVDGSNFDLLGELAVLQAMATSLQSGFQGLVSQFGASARLMSVRQEDAKLRRLLGLAIAVVATAMGLLVLAVLVLGAGPFVVLYGDLAPSEGEALVLFLGAGLLITQTLVYHYVLGRGFGRSAGIASLAASLVCVAPASAFLEGGRGPILGIVVLWCVRPVFAFVLLYLSLRLAGSESPAGRKVESGRPTDAS